MTVTQHKRDFAGETKVSSSNDENARLLILPIQFFLLGPTERLCNKAKFIRDNRQKFPAFVINIDRGFRIISPCCRRIVGLLLNGLKRIN
jgi:hypothetical protein